MIIYSFITVFPFYVLFIRSFVPTKESSDLHLWIPKAQEVNMDAEIGNLAVFYNLDLKDLKEALLPNPEEISDKAVSSQPSGVTNIKKYLKETTDLPEFRKKLKEYCLDYFAPCRIYTLTKSEEQEIEKLIREKYNTWEWNIAYSPPCVLSRSLLLSGREIPANISLKNGKIREISFAGDVELPEEILMLARFFSGFPYEKEAAERAADPLWKEEKVSVISQGEWIRFLFG